MSRTCRRGRRSGRRAWDRCGAGCASRHRAPSARACAERRRRRSRRRLAWRCERRGPRAWSRGNSTLARCVHLSVVSFASGSESSNTLATASSLSNGTPSRAARSRNRASCTSSTSRGNGIRPASKMRRHPSASRAGITRLLTCRLGDQGMSITPASNAAHRADRHVAVAHLQDLVDDRPHLAQDQILLEARTPGARSRRMWRAR